MSMSRGYRLPVKVAQQQRPLGVGLVAVLGILGSLALGVVAMIGIWSLMRISVAPSLRLGVLGLVLVAALVALRINWGFWELLKWAWWANLLLSLLSGAAAAFALGYVAEISKAIILLRPDLTTNMVAMVVRGTLLCNLAVDVLALVCAIGARAAFGVGVKDERPLWEKVHKF